MIQFELFAAMAFLIPCGAALRYRRRLAALKTESDRRLEAELREKTLLHETLLNAIQDAGIQLMLIEDGRVAYLSNRELARCAGWSDAEIDARPPLADFVHPDDRARVTGNHRRRLAGESAPSRYELALRGAAGERIEYEVAVSIVPGSAARAVAIGWEIGARKRAERDLVLLRRAIDQTSEGYFLMDGQWRVIDTNAAACASLGLHRKELLGLTPLDFDPDIAREALDRLMVAEPGASTTFETRHCARGGRVFPVEVTVSVFLDGGKRYALSMTRDISERKRMEKVLRRSEWQLRTVAENSTDLIFRYDPDCRRTYTNPAVSKAFRRVKDSLLGATPADNDLIDDKARYLDAIRHVFATGEIEHAPIVFASDSGPVDYDVQLIPETDAHGRIVSVFGVARDRHGA